ncbi:MAG: UDP-N-acetylmuramate dehydrogenase [Candidatus Omnitrophota bacterium]
MNWQKSLKGKVRINEQLAKHTSFKVGGPVQYWFEPSDTPDLQNLVVSARKRNMPLRVIGAGSNILADDAGVKGIVVKLNSPCFKKITDGQAFACFKPRLSQKARVINVGAGLSLVKLVRYTKDNGLAGCELLAGIPGTVGGALVMNAGNIGDSVLSVSVMNRDGRVNILTKRDIQFGYRNSTLNDCIILSTYLKLIKKDKRIVARNIGRYFDYRRKTQDLSRPSAGCIFKNPDKKPAAYFIERCGLKGSSFGDAAISFKHANFIINKGRANFIDITKLIAYIIRSVKKKFNLKLEPEIKIWKQI